MGYNATACLLTQHPSPAHKMDTHSGYECEFVDVLPLQLQHECAVCLMTLREPYLTDCCGNSFCRLCIQRVQSNKLPCPLCNETPFNIFPNKWLQRSLREFQVYCAFKKSGCEWSGKLGELEKHLNYKPTSETRMNGCLYVELDCTYSCGTAVQRHSLLAHEESCVRRPYTCEYCHNFQSPYNEIVDHWNDCGSYLILCPNECTTVTFERNKLDWHLNEECPLIVSRCSICESEVPRGMLSFHVQQHSATNETKNVYLDYHHPCIHEESPVAVGDYDSLNSQLRSEIALRHELQEQIETDKARSEQIRQEINELKKSCECKMLQLKSELQVKEQAVDEYRQAISRKENEIAHMNGIKESGLAEDRAAYEKQITLLNEEYEQKMVQYQQKKTDSEAEKLRYELELEKTKYKYDMKIKELELKLERKKRELAERENEGYKRDKQIHELQTEIELDKERKEKARLMEQQTQEIEKLKRDNASLKRQLQSVPPRPEQPKHKPNEDYM